MGDPLNINRPYNEPSGEKTSFSKKEKAKDYTGHTYSHEENPDASVKKVSGVKDQTIAKGGGLHLARYDAAELFKPRAFHPFSESQFKAFLEEKGIDGIQKFVESKGREKVAKAVKDSSFVQFAAEKGHLELVKYLVDELKCDANVVHDRFSPLISAAKEGHAEVVEFLLPHSSPSAFVDLQSHRAGVISYAAAAREPNQALIRSLIDNRDKFPIPIVGCIPVAVHLVQTNREQVTQWLKEKFNENVREGESDATLLARVVNLAHSFEKHALEIAVRDEEPFFVDLLIAAGTQPELGKNPAELTNNPLILSRLNEAQEAANSFRSRQLGHLLKHYASETMSPADQVLSWSTLIATLQSAPQLSHELEDLAILLNRSLAMSFIVENPLFSAAEKRDYIRQQMDSLNTGEAILVNDHHQYGHHRVNLIEKREDQQWLRILGDRYRGGSHNRQISDSRMNLNSEDAEMLILGQVVKGPNVSGKIMKKWQGAENNCVTQSDTVAFDYLLGEKLEQSKAVIYRQLKPLRVA